MPTALAESASGFLKAKEEEGKEEEEVIREDGWSVLTGWAHWPHHGCHDNHG